MKWLPRCNVSVLTHTKIPAMTPVTPASPVPTDYCCVVMPHSACDIIVAHSLGEVQNGTTVVRILNPSRDDIQLHSGEHLGEFHSASSVDIVPLEETCCVTTPIYDVAPPVKLNDKNLAPSQI